MEYCRMYKAWVVVAEVEGRRSVERTTQCLDALYTETPPSSGACALK